MKHKLLSKVGILLAIGFVSTTLNAQESTVKSAKVLYFDNEACGGGDFHAISPNGRYAVGYSPEITLTAYLWDRETNELTILDGGANDGCAEANAVSNDGIVVGAFFDINSPDKNNRATLVPGYWKEGQWTKLPRVEGMPNYGSGMNGTAEAISADGTIIGGYILRQTGVNVQVLWKDDQLQPVSKINYELQPVSEEDLLGQGNVGLCFAQEGRIIGGYANHDDGSRSPAIWKDGVMTRLDGLKSATEIYEETGEDMGFFDGQVRHFSPDGKYGVGYFDPSGDGYECKPFIWSEEKGLEYFSDAGFASVMTNDKTIYGAGGYMGAAFIYKDGIMMDLDEYLKDEYNFVPGKDYSPMSTPLGVSDDGKTIVGWTTQVVEGLGAIMKPMIIILEEKPAGIAESANAENLSIDSNVIDNNLKINGHYTSAQVYNSVGALVSNDNRLDGNISFESQENGVYFVKVSNGTQSQTFKVVKK